jgi:hypothetical protein
MNDRARLARWAGLSLVWAVLFLFAWKDGRGDVDFDLLMAIGGFVVSYVCFRRLRRLRS